MPFEGIHLEFQANAGLRFDPDDESIPACSAMVRLYFPVGIDRIRSGIDDLCLDHFRSSHWRPIDRLIAHALKQGLSKRSNS
jgi:hypothetical protein